MRILGILIAVALCVGLSGKAEAAPITYHEAVDGRLSASTPLVMGSGTNIVTGTGCWGIPIIGCNTLTNFAFEIPENMQMTGYRYIIGDVDTLYWHSFPRWQGMVAIKRMGKPGLNISNVGDWLLGQEQTLAVDLLAPLGSGYYRQFVIGSRTGVFGSWDFRIELDIAPALAEIPLPATILFFGMGLGLMGLARRRMTCIKA